MAAGVDAWFEKYEYSFQPRSYSSSSFVLEHLLSATHEKEQTSLFKTEILGIRKSSAPWRLNWCTVRVWDVPHLVSRLAEFGAS